MKKSHNSWIKICAAILVYVVLLARIDRLFFKSNACFCVHFIQRSHPATTTTLLPAQIDALLSQPFTYLARGLHCYAFLSQDGTAVLKFHRTPSQARKNAWFIHPFSGNEKKMQRFAYFMNNYVACSCDLQEETGCLWLHTRSSPALRKKALLIDKTGTQYTVDLNETTFILQSAAQPIYTVLQTCDLEQAKTIVTQIIELLQSSYLKGYVQTDPVIKTNFGLLSDRAIFIDFGDVIKRDTALTLASYLEKATYDLCCWLKNNRPLLLDHFEMETKRCAS